MREGARRRRSSCLSNGVNSRAHLLQAHLLQLAAVLLQAPLALLLVGRQLPAALHRAGFGKTPTLLSCCPGRCGCPMPNG